ncbi:MAG: class I SAM-dependent methyltransferase [Myxococcales bacterium]|nr:class I SAM-dependent methyltransferase [Myxococcales bacterium]
MEEMIDTQVTEHLDAEVVAGQAAYTPGFLPYYDLLVLRINNPLLWKCPTSELLELYNRNVSALHLDVGVGSGYYLENCRFATDQPTLALMDLNSNSLRFVRERLSRYHDVRLFRRNVLEPVTIDSTYDSLGMNYLLHCLPGRIEDKAKRVFDNLQGCVKPGGTVFGSTLLYEGSAGLNRAVLKLYQRSGAMSNRWDSMEGLERALESSFRRHSVTRRGIVAMFSATV